MEESALISHIAFTSGNAKNAFAMAGAGAVIEILKGAGAIEEHGGTLIASDKPIDDSSSPTSELVHIPQEKDAPPLRQTTSAGTEEEDPSWTGKSFTSLSINISISCTPEQLDGLGQKLRKLQQEFEGVSDIDIKLKTEGAEGAGAEPASNS